MGYLDELMKEGKKTQETKKEEPSKLPVKETAKEGEIIPEKKEAGEIAIKGSKTLIKSYGEVNIYKVEGEPLPIYSIPVVKPAGPEKTLLNTIKEAATRLITVSPEEIRDPEARRKFYFKRIKEIIEASPELGVPRAKIDFYADMTVREMIGYGILDLLTRDDKLEEIMVIGPLKPVYVFHREYDMMKTNIRFGNNEEIKNIIDRIAREVNRRVDSQTPMLDARMPDGSRVNATIPPVSLEGATLTVRKFRKDPISVVDMIKYGTTSAELAAFMWLAVDGYGTKPANILVSGGTGSGKTTTLNVLCSFIPARERIITMEDTAELNLPLDHWIRFETRPPGLEGTGEITMDLLVKNSLRMRPDRIIVGEIRHAEAFTLFTAMNTGHDGSMGTIHANSAHETILRLQSPPMEVPSMMLEALNFVIVQQRIYDRKKGTIRRITEFAELEAVEGDKASMQILFQWDPITDTIKNTGVPSKYLQELMKFTGASREDLLEELEKRKRFIEDLSKRGITKMDYIVKEFRNYKGGS
jgi:flagellar protein FlaI